MYQQQKRELMERQSKNTEGFPGLIEKVKLEPVIEDKKSKAAGKQTSSQQTTVSNDTTGTKKKVGRPKKTVI
jgi:hypothetical protein